MGIGSNMAYIVSCNYSVPSKSNLKHADRYLSLIILVAKGQIHVLICQGGNELADW